jgi:hypothetical protein
MDCARIADAAPHADPAARGRRAEAAAALVRARVALTKAPQGVGEDLAGLLTEAEQVVGRGR